VAVSLEQLQANIIRAALPPNRAPVGVPLGAGVGAGGVARAAVQEAKGEEVLPPAELSCKVCRVLPSTHLTCRCWPIVGSCIVVVYGMRRYVFVLGRLNAGKVFGPVVMGPSIIAEFGEEIQGAENHIPGRIQSFYFSKCGTSRRGTPGERSVAILWSARSWLSSYFPVFVWSWGLVFTPVSRLSSCHIRFCGKGTIFPTPADGTRSSA